MDDQLQSRLHYLGPYLPTDRFRALVAGRLLPESSAGAVLLADISGYTPLAARLVQDFGPQRASEELQKRINPMFEALAGQVFHQGGSVIRFLGDGFIAWFDETVPHRPDGELNAALRAAAAAVEMMAIMGIFRDLELRVAVGYGPVSRWVVGAKEHGLVDLLVGPAVNDATQAAQPYKEPGVVMSVAALTQILDYPGVEVNVLPRGECRVRSIAPDLLKAAKTFRWPAWELAVAIEKAVEDVSRFVPPVVHNQIARGSNTFVNELRYATPMFIQFDGIDYDYDPQAHAQLDAYLREIQHISAETGGQLISVEVSDKGSVVYIVHGAPISYRNDTLRAVQSALKIQTLKRRHETVAWQSIGIARGLLYAGTVGGEVRHEYTAIGDSTNLAAHLMVAAGTDQVLATERVQLETEEDFDWQTLPPVQLKGREAPVKAAQPVRRRYDTKTVQRFGQLVGRDEEIADFRRWLGTVLEGRPQIIRISGQPGVGKSYMAAEFLSLASAYQLRVTRGNCLSLGSQISFLPWRPVIQDLLDLRDSWPDDKKREAIPAYLEKYHPDLLPRWDLLAELLDLPAPDNPPRPALESHRRLKAIQAAAIDLIWQAATRQPLCILIEDTHWLDEVSEALLIDIVKKLTVHAVPLMVILVHRTPGEAPYDQKLLRILRGQAYHHHLALEEIPEEAVAQIVEERLKAPSPPELTRFIYEKTRGNVFFVQELVDTLRETEAVVVIGKEVFIEKDLDNIVLPRTVLEMAQSRIDSLDEEERMVLKIAAVIGGAFSQALLARSLPVDISSDELARLLNLLVARDFLQVDAQGEVYTFKHAILQEVTYTALLSRQREQLHMTVGLALEQLEPTAWEKLAHHFLQTEAHQRALTYLLRAGDEARQAHANRSALRFYEQALALIEDDETAFHTLSHKIRVLFRMGDLAGVQMAMTEIEDCLARLGERVDYRALLGSFRARYNYQVSAWDAAIDTARQVLDYAEPHNDLMLMWHSYEVMRESYRHLNDVQSVSTITARMQHVAAQMDDSYRTLQLLLDDLDDLHHRYPQRAEKGLAEAYQEIKSLNNIWVEYKYWQVMARVRRRNQDYPAALEACQHLLSISQQIGNQRQEGHTLNTIGLLLIQMGQFSEGNNYLQWAYRLLHQNDDKAGEARSLAALGVLAQRYGAYDEAVAYLRRSQALFEVLGLLDNEAQVTFLLGNVLLDKQALDEAAAAFQHAVDISMARDDTLAHAEYTLGMAHYAQLADQTETVANWMAPAAEAMLVQFPYEWVDLGLAYWRLIGLLRVEGEDDEAQIIYGFFQDFIQHMLDNLEDEQAQQAVLKRVFYFRDLLESTGYPQLARPSAP